MKRPTLHSREDILTDFQRRAGAITLSIPDIEILAPGEFFDEPTPQALAQPRASKSLKLPHLQRKTLAVGLAAAVAMSVLFWSLARWRGLAAERAQRFFPLPLAGAAALAEEGGQLHALDPKRGLLITLKLESGAPVISMIRKLPNPSATGLAAGSGVLWTAESRGILRRHAPDKELSVTLTFANPESSLSALFWDGRSLWAADSRTETLFEFTPGNSLLPAGQYTLAGLAPAGLSVSGRVLWVLDGPSKKIQRFRLGGVLSTDGSADLTPWLKSGSRAAGFIVSDEWVWILSENPAGLHRLDARRAFPRGFWDSQ